MLPEHIEFACSFILKRRLVPWPYDQFDEHVHGVDAIGLKAAQQRLVDLCIPAEINEEMQFPEEEQIFLAHGGAGTDALLELKAFDRRAVGEL